MGLAFVSAIWTCQEQPLRWTASREPAGFVTLQRDGCSVATACRMPFGRGQVVRRCCCVAIFVGHGSRRYTNQAQHSAGAVL